MRYEDLTGRRFGRLVVLERTDSHVKKNGDKQTVFLCRCDCGNVRKVFAYNLKNGHTFAYRLNCGWTVEDALFKPLKGVKNGASRLSNGFI